MFAGFDSFSCLEVMGLDDISSMKIHTIAMAVLLSFSSCAVFAENIDYCSDSSASQQWERVVSKYKYFSTWKSLDRLRNGLCLQVERGSISMNEAASLFEREKAKKMRILRERKDKIRGRKRILLG